MTLNIELTPGEEARLVEAASREGVQPADLARRMITAQLPFAAPDCPDGDPTLRLFEQWEAEDQSMTSEDLAEEQRQWDDFKKSIDAERTRSGSRTLF